MDFWKFALTGDTGAKPKETKEEDEPISNPAVKKTEDKPSIWKDGSIQRKKFEDIIGRKDYSGCTFVFDANYRDHAKELRDMLKEALDSIKDNSSNSFDKGKVGKVKEFLRKKYPNNTTANLLIKLFEESLKQ